VWADKPLGADKEGFAIEHSSLEKPRRYRLKNCTWQTLGALLFPIWAWLPAWQAWRYLGPFLAWFISAAGPLGQTMGRFGLILINLTPRARFFYGDIRTSRTAMATSHSSTNQLLGLLRILRLWVWDRVSRKTQPIYTNKRPWWFITASCQRLDQNYYDGHVVVFCLPWVYALLSYVAVVGRFWLIYFTCIAVAIKRFSAVFMSSLAVCVWVFLQSRRTRRQISRCALVVVVLFSLIFRINYFKPFVVLERYAQRLDSTRRTSKTDGNSLFAASSWVQAIIGYIVRLFYVH